jgi:adenosine deaminase
MALERIPLTVCPTSNVVIANRFRSLAEHPLPRMRAAGLLVTINTDDPAMEDLDLGREYRNVAEAHGWSVEDMAQLAIEGVESTWLDASDRAGLAREFEATLAGL